MTVIALSTNASIQAWELEHSNADVVVNGVTLTGVAAAAYLFGQALRSVDPLAFGTVGQGRVNRQDPVFEFPPASGNRVSITELADGLRYKYSVDPLIEFSLDIGLQGYTVGDLNGILSALNREYAGRFQLDLLDVASDGAQTQFEVLGLPSATLLELLSAEQRQALLALAGRLRADVLGQSALAIRLQTDQGIGLDEAVFTGEPASGPRVSLRQILQTFQDDTGADLLSWLPASYVDSKLNLSDLEALLAAAREANPTSASTLGSLSAGWGLPDSPVADQLAELRRRWAVMQPGQASTGLALNLGSSTLVRSGTLDLARVLMANLSESDELVSRLSFDAGIGLDEAVWRDQQGDLVSLRNLLSAYGLTSAVLAALPELAGPTGLDFHRVDRLIDTARALNPAVADTLDWTNPWMRDYTTQWRTVHGAQAVFLRVADAVLTLADNTYRNTPLASTSRVFVDPTDGSGQRRLSLDELGLLLTRLVGANPMERKPQWYATDLVALAQCLYAGVQVDPPIAAPAAVSSPAIEAVDLVSFVNKLVLAAGVTIGPDLLDADAAVFAPASGSTARRSLRDLLGIFNTATGLDLAPRLESAGVLREGQSVQLRGLNALMSWVRTEQPGLVTAANLPITGSPTPADAQIDYAAVLAETSEDAWGLQAIRQLMTQWAAVPNADASAAWPLWQSRLRDVIADLNSSVGGLAGVGLSAQTVTQIQALTQSVTPPAPFANGPAILNWLQNLAARVSGAIDEFDANISDLSAAAGRAAYQDATRQAAIQTRIQALNTDRAAFVAAGAVIQRLQAAGATGASFEAALAAERQAGRNDVLSWLSRYDVPLADLQAVAYQTQTGAIPWFDWSAWQGVGRSGSVAFTDSQALTALGDPNQAWVEDETLDWLWAMSLRSLPALHTVLTSAQATVAQSLQANPGSASLTSQAQQLTQYLTRLDALQAATNDLLALKDQPVAFEAALQQKAVAFGGDFLAELARFDVQPSDFIDPTYKVTQPALSVLDIDDFWAAGDPDATIRSDLTLSKANADWLRSYTKPGAVADWFAGLRSRLEDAVSVIDTAEAEVTAAWLQPSVAETGATLLEDALESLREGRALRRLALDRVSALVAAATGPVSFREKLAELDAAVGGNVFDWLGRFDIDPAVDFAPGGLVQTLGDLTWPDLAASEMAAPGAQADWARGVIELLDLNWTTDTDPLFAPTLHGQANPGTLSQLQSRLQGLVADLSASVEGLDTRLTLPGVSNADRAAMERARWVTAGRLEQVQAVRDSLARLVAVAAQPAAFATQLTAERQALGVDDVLAYASRFDISTYQRDQFRDLVGGVSRTFDLGLWQAAHSVPSVTDADLTAAFTTWEASPNYRAWLNRLRDRIAASIDQMDQDRLNLYLSLGAPGNDDAQTNQDLAQIGNQSLAFARALQVVDALKRAATSSTQFAYVLQQQKASLANQGLTVNDISVWLRDFDVSASARQAAQDEAAALSSFSWTTWRTAQSGSPFADADAAIATPLSWTQLNAALASRQAAVDQQADDAQRGVDIAAADIAVAMGPRDLETDAGSSTALSLALAVTQADQRADARREALSHAQVDAQGELISRMVAFGTDGRVYQGAEAVLVRVAGMLSRLGAQASPLSLTTPVFTDPMWPGRALSLTELDGWFREATGFSLLAKADPSAQRLQWTRDELRFIVAQANAVLARVPGAEAAVVLTGSVPATLSLTGGGTLTAAALQAQLRSALLASDLQATSLDSSLLTALSGLVSDFDQIAPDAFFSSLAQSGGSAASLNQALSLLQNLGSPFNRPESYSLLVSELNQLITALSDPAPASESADLKAIVAAASDTALRFQYGGDVLSLLSQGALSTSDLTGLSEIQAALPSIQQRLSDFKAFLQARRATVQARIASYETVAGPYRLSAPAIEPISGKSYNALISATLTNLAQTFTNARGSAGGANSFTIAFSQATQNLRIDGQYYTLPAGVLTLSTLRTWVVNKHGANAAMLYYIDNASEPLNSLTVSSVAPAMELTGLASQISEIANDPNKNTIVTQYAAAQSKLAAIDADLAELEAGRQSLVALRSGAATSGADLLDAATAIGTAQLAYVGAGDVFGWLRSFDVDATLLWNGTQSQATGWDAVIAERDGTIDQGFDWDDWKAGLATDASSQALTAYQGANTWTTASVTALVDVSGLPAAKTAITTRAQSLIDAVNTVRNASQQATVLPDGLLDIDGLSFEVPADLATYSAVVLNPARRTEVVSAVGEMQTLVEGLLDEAALNSNRLPSSANEDFKTLADRLNADLGVTDFVDSVTKTAFQTADFQVSNSIGNLGEYFDGLATGTSALTSNVQSQINFATTRLSAYQNTLYPWSVANPATATAAFQAKVDAVFNRIQDIYLYVHDWNVSEKMDVGGAFRSAMANYGNGLTLTQLRALAVNAPLSSTDSQRLIALIDFAETNAGLPVPTTFNEDPSRTQLLTGTLETDSGRWTGGLFQVSNELRFTQLSQDSQRIAALKTTAAAWKTAIDNNALDNNPEQTISFLGYSASLLEDLRLVGWTLFGKNAINDRDDNNNNRSDSWLARLSGGQVFSGDTSVTVKAYQELTAGIQALESRGKVDEMVTAVTTEKTGLQTQLTELTLAGEVIAELQAAVGTSSQALATKIQELTAATAPASPAVTLHDRLAPYLTNHDLFAWLRKFDVPANLVWSDSRTSTSFQVPVNQWSGTSTTPTIVNNSYTISNWTTDPAAQSQTYLSSPSGVIAPQVYELYRNGLLEAEAAGKFRSGYFDWLAWQGGTAKDVSGNALAAYETADPALNQATVLAQLNSGQGVSLAGFQQLKTLLDTLVELLAQPKSFRDLVARAQSQTHADLMSVLEKLGVVADQHTLSRDAISRLALVLDGLNPANVDPALIPAPDADAFESDKNLSLEAFQRANDPLQAHLRLLEEAQALLTRFAQRSLPDQLDAASQLSADIRAFVSRNRDSLDDTLAAQLETFANTGLPGATASFDSVQGPSYVPHLTFIHQARIRAAGVVENLDSSLRSLDLLHGTMSAIQPKPTASLTKLEALITRLNEQRAEFASAQRVANELLAVVPASATLVTLRGETLAQYQAVVKRLQVETGQDDLMSFLHDHAVPPASLTDNTYRATFTDANAGVNPPTYFSVALWSDTSNPAYRPQGAAATSLSLDGTLAADQFTVTGTSLPAASLSDASLVAIDPVLGSAAWTTAVGQVDSAVNALNGQLAALHARLRLNTTDVADLLGALRSVTVPGGQQGFWYRLGRSLSTLNDMPVEGVNLSAPMIEYPPGLGERVSFNQLLSTLQTEIDGGGEAASLASQWLDDLRSPDVRPAFNAAETAQKVARVSRFTQIKTAIETTVNANNWAQGGVDMAALLAKEGWYVSGQLWDDTVDAAGLHTGWRTDAIHWNEILNWASAVEGPGNALEVAVDKSTGATQAEVTAAMTVLSRVLLDLNKGAQGQIGDAQVRMRWVREAMESAMDSGRDDLMRLVSDGKFRLSDLDGRNAIQILTSSQGTLDWTTTVSNPVNRSRLLSLLQGQLINERDQKTLALDVQAALDGTAGTTSAWSQKLSSAIDGLLSTYNSKTWDSGTTAALGTRLNQLLTTTELSELRSSIRALRAGSGTLSVLPLAQQVTDLNSPADTASRLDAALAEGANASQADWLASISEMRWLLQGQLRTEASRVLSEGSFPAQVTDRLGALTGGDWNDSDLSVSNFANDADRNDVLLQIYLTAKSYLDNGSSTWPKEFRQAFAYDPATYGLDASLAGNAAAAIDFGLTLKELHDLGKAFKGYDSTLVYALKDASGEDNFGTTAGRALSKTDFTAAVAELETLLKQGFRQNRVNVGVNSVLTVIENRQVFDPFQVSEVLSSELSRGMVDDGTRRVMLSAIRKAIPAAQEGLVAWAEPSLSAAESRRAATLAQRLAQELARAESDVNRAQLPSATNVELRRDLTEGGDVYVDRHGSYYINGTRTRAMDLAVTTRFLAHENFASEYKVLMDQLAERNNLIAGARLFVDRVDSATTTATAASPALARAAQAGFDALTDMGADDWSSEVGTVTLADRQTLKTTMESWAAATGSDDVLWDVSAGRISLKDIEGVAWSKQMFADLRLVMQNFIKTESLYAPLKAQNGSVKSGDLLGELTGGKYTSDPAKMSLTKSAERMWTMLEWETGSLYSTNGVTGLSAAMRQVIQQEKVRNGGVDVMSLATDGAYTAENWATQAASLPSATITSLKTSLSTYMGRGADRPLHYTGDLTDVTNLLNTLISNKVRDNDLDQGKLQSITSQLQVNTEAMTALIKAFNELNSALAQALKR